MLKRTALFEAHQKLGARLIDFGGWEMPVQYTSIVDEHQAVRNAAGIFDISHMGEVTVAGPNAAEFLNVLLTNDIRRLGIGQGQYSLMCNEQGGAVDDLYVYHVAPQTYLLVVNASRIDADIVWMQQQLNSFQQKSGIELSDASHNYAAVAVQGPKVKEFIDAVVPGASSGGTKVELLSDLKKNEIAIFSFGGGNLFVGRTGYTGEDGFEIIGLNHAIQAVWDKVLEAGKPFGCKPCGLGARDTLRTEVCYPLYGHELDENTTPVEAGLSFFIAFEKGEFIGRAALLDQKTKGPFKKLVAFKMTDKSAPPRPHYPIWSADGEAKQIGEVVSGTQSPSLGIGIGLGYVPPESGKIDAPIQIEVRGRKCPAVIIKKPFYRK
ncbi:MAG: glycine cleavage system aminomethyltransferase GcvT [Verrucomicrobia bacterium]|nr:glycine cleavage system aminomethyltransferase GcvT [Verrucomicrobiota bacterium]